MGFDRSDFWFTALVVFCALLAAGAIAFEIDLTRDEEPAAQVATTSTVVAPPPEPAPTGVAPANPPAEDETPVERVAREADPKPPGSAEKPYVTVRNGAEVAIRSAPAGSVVTKAGDRTEFGSPTVFSVDRVRGSWLGVSTPDVPNGSLGWVRADPGKITGGYTDYRIVVDLSSHDARLRQGSRLLRRWPVTVGSPDTPTPTGSFAVTDLFRGGLNPAYGCCAVALSATQPNLPTGWSGGDRIAIHGTDGPLGVDTSTGCVRSRDKDVSALVDTVPLGTPVTIQP